MTSEGRPSRIHLKGQASQFEEALAAGVIRPGHLVKLNVDGDVIPHNIVLGQAERMFALEDALQGRGIDDDYASGERVFILIASPGDQVLAWLAFGQSVQKGDFLGSDGAGHLIDSQESGFTAGHDSVAVALETIDNSESDDNNTRIKVRVL
jgi:hypothetical protein